MLGLPIHKEESPPEVHSDFIFSIIQPSKQHAEIICEANRNFRLQASYGHPKPAYGHSKLAYVHPKAANGDFTKPREQFYKGAGRSSEGYQEGCFRLLPPIPRGSACGKEHIKAFVTPACMPSEATCHQAFHTVCFGSPDKAGGEIPQTKRKVIHLHHEHTRTFSIGAVDSAIRDTFKL